ncbi:MAG: hypothetical protein ACLRI8_05095 [Agathobacter rectalis]
MGKRGTYDHGFISGKYEIVNPSVSILAQPSVAIVDDNAKSNGTKR